MFGASFPPDHLESAFARRSADWTDGEVRAVCEWLCAEAQLRRLLYVASRLLGGASPQDAEDVVQEFLAHRIWGVFRNWDPVEGAFSAYFGTAFRHHCLAFRRKLAQQRAREATLPDQEWGDLPVSISPNEYLGVYALVMQCVNELPVGQRAVAIRSFFLDQPYTEIAEELGISGENSRVRLHRSRTKLMQCLERLGVDVS